MSRAHSLQVCIATLFVAALLSVAGTLSTSAPAWATDRSGGSLGEPACPTTALWSFQTAQGFLPAAVSGAPYGLDLVFVSSGTIFYAFWAETVPGPGGHTAGTIAWQVNAPFGVTFENDPVIANLSFGRGVVVLSSTSEARVICLDAATGTIRWLSLRVRRPECGDDTIVASPAVQLWDFSNSAFRTAVPNDDLVFVITKYQCGTTTENRVYGFNASDGTTNWAFNDPPTVSMDYGAEGCSIDYVTNTLYCGTNVSATNPGQHSIWGIDSRNAALKWSHNAGSILSRPMVRGSRVYVGDQDGFLRARNAATGAHIWALDLTPGPAAILKNVWPEFRSPFQQYVLAADATGVLHAVIDDGVTIPAAPAWSTVPGLSVSSLGAVAPSLGKLYVGMTDGTLHQLNFATGVSENSTIVKAGAPVSMASLDSAQAGALPNRLNTAAGGAERRYCIPWASFVDVEPGPDAGGLNRLTLESAPNPFSGTTRLSFRLATAAHARLTVHDARGRLVRTIEDADRAAGPATMEWDARDDAGTRVPAGVYFAKLTLERESGIEKADRVLIIAR
ncbi:MAG: PQQ-binding-like beta-propeller repeat protein [Candidatus Eiseniibacteriota bacterium]